MSEKLYSFNYQLYSDLRDLTAEDQVLVKLAFKATENAYAPYSHFHVAAVARLANGEVVAGTNQENASYPVGICAERTLLSTLANLYPGIAIDTMVVTYINTQGEVSGQPVSPCGLCRQSLLEYEQRLNHPIRILLTGREGHIIGVAKAADLLPFSFSNRDMGI